jgi:hypothetical protein
LRWPGKKFKLDFPFATSNEQDHCNFDLRKFDPTKPVARLAGFGLGDFIPLGV